MGCAVRLLILNRGEPMEKMQIKMDDGFLVSVALYEAENPKALVQIIHGAVEYKGRYEKIACFLQKNGYNVLVSDNRGHGESVNDKYSLGYMNNVYRMVQDQVEISRWLRERYSEMPLYLIGHSLGSIFARLYLQEHDKDIKRLVLSGTVPFIPASGAGALFGKLVVKLDGEMGHNKLLLKLSGIGGEDDSWLVSNKESLEAYRKDPYCGYEYPNVSTLTMIQSVYELHNFKAFKVQNPTLPIFCISGSKDPITGGEKGLKRTEDDFRKLGYHGMVNKVYEGMCHEVLNEVEREKVYADILEFFER